VSSRSPRNWGRWGPEDEIGTLNLLDAATVQRAAGLIRHGRVVSLGMPLARKGFPIYPTRQPILHFMTKDGGDYAAGAVAPHDFGAADDYVVLALHGGTHIDALSHVWTEGHLYNGYPSTEVRSSGAARNGIDKIPPIVGRGIFLDIPRLKHVEHLGVSEPITPQDLEDAEREFGVTCGSGDVVLIRTGWYRVFADDAALYYSGQPGITGSAASWLAERDVAAVGADNLTVECFPDPAGGLQPAHRLLLRDCGIHLIELLDLEELAATQVREFLFVACPLRIKRAVGSPINPIAIY
jgi:kynurenine formamidase